MAYSESDVAPSQQDAPDTVEERLEDLAQELESLANERRAIQRHELEPAIDDLRDASDDARQERAELASRVDDLEQVVHGLAGQLESLIGLSEDHQSTPQKRELDLAQALIRRAESKDDAKNDAGQGSASMYWKEVQDQFAVLGHGHVKKPLCYRAMRSLYGKAGFSEGEKTSMHGNTVEAVRVNLAELPADAPSNNITTSGTGPAASEASDPAVEVTNEQHER